MTEQMDVDPARIVRVVDIETTGLKEEKPEAEICEIGWIDIHLSDMTIRDPVQFFVDPGHPIPPEVRAVHHISDADVKNASSPAEAIEALHKGLGDDDILGAHNNRYEMQFLPSPLRWIDTYRCALRAWPSSPAHTNQTLRYVLGLDGMEGFDSDAAMPPHRALPDAYVTAWIARELLRMRSVERAVAVSAQPGVLPGINFGKHKGSRWQDVPIDYLEWMVHTATDMDEDRLFTARMHLRSRLDAQTA